MRDLALPSYFYRQITTNEERYQLGADNLAVHYTVAKGQLYSFATEGKKQTPKTVILRADLKLDRDELAIVRRLILQGFKIYFVKDCNSSELDKFNLKSLQETPEIIHFSDYKNKTQDEILSFCANAAHKKQDEILFLDKKILLEITELNCQKSKVVFFRDIMANSGGKFQQAFEDFYGNEAITIIIDFVSPPLLEKIAFLLLEKKESVTVLYRNTELYIPLQNKQGEKYFVKKEVADALSESLMANTDNVIDLVFTPPIHFDKSLKFCENRRNIKSVTWMDFNTIHGSDLQKLATCEWISKIESLTLLGCEYIYRNEVEFDFPLQNLKKLDLTGSRITQKQFSCLIKNLPNLEEISINNFFYISDAKAAIKFLSKKLKKVTLKNVFFEKELLPLLEYAEELILHDIKKIEEISFLKIRKLTLKQSAVLLPELVNILESAVNLEFLSLESCRSLPKEYQRCYSGSEIKELIHILRSKNTQSAAHQLPPSYSLPGVSVDAKHDQLPEKMMGSSSVKATNAPKMQEKNVKKRDADTRFDPDKEFFERVIFYAPHGKESPSPEKYRLSIFNKLEVNSNICSVKDAFEIKSAGALLLSEPIDCVRREEDLFSELNELVKDGSERYYGKIAITLDQEWQALPSLFSKEALTHYHLSNPGVEIEIRYSARDNLYYIKNKNKVSVDIEIDFLIHRGKEKINQCYWPCKSENAMQLPKRILEIVKRISDFGIDKKSVLPPDMSGDDHMLRIIENSVGACRHRSAAFMYLLQKSEESLPEKTPIRIVSNDSHEFIEININGQWLTCDLGGYPAKSIYDDKYKPVEKPLPASAQAKKEGIQIPVGVEDKKPVVSEVFSTSKNQEIPSFEPKKPSDNYFPEEKKSENLPLKIYLEKLCNGEHDKHLLTMPSRNTDGFSYHLQKYCKVTGRPYFYVRSADDLICASPTIKRKAGNENEGDITAVPGGSFYEFLQKNKSNCPVIIIDFNQFSDEDKIKFNSILDDVKNVDGVELPEKTTVIALLDPNKPGSTQDASFYSRFGDEISPCSYAESETPLPDVNENKFAECTYQINLYASSQWEMILKGSWYLNDHTPCMLPGELIKAFSEGHSKIEILNPPDDPAFRLFIAEAMLKGCFYSEGQKIVLPEGFSISVKTHYNFSNAQITVCDGLPPKETMVLNSDLFLRFFYEDKVVPETGGLRRDNGIIENYAHKTLSLYLNESLTDNQWAKLIDYCSPEKNNVKLQLYLAPGIKIPDAIKVLHAGLREVHFEKVGEHTSYIQSSDRDVTLRKLQGQHPESIIIDISELGVSDLIRKIEGSFNKETLQFHFSEKEMFLLKALSDPENKTVILYGTFKSELVNNLTKLIVERFHSENPSGKLILVAEDRNPFGNILESAVYDHAPEEKAAFLEHEFSEHDLKSKKLCELLAMERSSDPWVGMENSFPILIDVNAEIDLVNAEDKSKVFNEARIDLVSKMLEKSPFAFLSGATGIGKTSFIEKYWHNPVDGRVVYRSQDFKKWVEDQAPGITKTLFIDEATITQKNWSQFESLFFDPPSILVDDHVVKLTKDHKIIFSGNPVSYSEDRSLPSLFERHGNACPFQPLPPFYIYHEMLAPLFQNTTLNPENISKPVLEIYQFLVANSKDEILITPREMTMALMLTIAYCDKNKGADPVEVAKYFSYELTEQYVNHLDEKTQSDFRRRFKTELSSRVDIVIDKKSSFLITASNQSVANALDDFLVLREFRRTNHAQLNQGQLTAGLGAFTLEGEPGLGKSEIIRAILISKGYKKGDEKADLSDQNIFYEVRASYSRHKKIELLLKAYFQGSAVIWDEMNCSVSMEEILNDLMMHKIPSDPYVEKIMKEKYVGIDPQPGFIVLGTQNPAKTMSGRHETSLAILHRSHLRVMPDYPRNEMVQVMQHLHVPEKHANALVDQYSKKREKEKLTFRHLTKKAKKVAKAYVDECEVLQRQKLEFEEKKEMKAISDAVKSSSLFSNSQAKGRLINILELLNKNYNENGGKRPILKNLILYAKKPDSTYASILKEIENVMNLCVKDRFGRMTRIMSELNAELKKPGKVLNIEGVLARCKK